MHVKMELNHLRLSWNLLIEMGGKELAMAKDDNDRTVLYFAFEDENINLLDKKIISKLKEIEGQELVLALLRVKNHQAIIMVK